MGVVDGFCIGKIQEFQDWDKVDDWLSGGGDSIGYAVGGVFYIYSAEIISQKTLEQTSETVEQFSNSLDNYMTLMSNKMEILADSPVIQEELNAAPNDYRKG